MSCGSFKCITNYAYYKYVNSSNLFFGNFLKIWSSGLLF